jgi:hypothetical protein
MMRIPWLSRIIRTGMIRESLKIHISPQLMKLLVKQLAIPLGNQPKNFWPGTRKTVAKWLVISCQKALHNHSAKSPKDGDISRWLTATKWLVMLRCVKNFLLTYNPYAARRNEVSV